MLTILILSFVLSILVIVCIVVPTVHTILYALQYSQLFFNHPANCLQNITLYFCDRLLGLTAMGPSRFNSLHAES